ncbi:MAG: hypothetical protein JO057_20330 [Chloroflexi bacterium]|nr:hypothetical protein [Chloroflexota bacterium]
MVIERLLEAFWNFQDSTKGAFWPLSVVHEYIDARVAQFATFVDPYLKRLQEADDLLTEAHAGDANWKSTIDAITQDLDGLPAQVETLANNVQTLELGNDQKLTYLLSRTSGAINTVLNAHPDLNAQLGKGVDLAREMTDDLYSFVRTFNDNPARRIISLVVGCLAGFIVSAALRLDLFAALGLTQLTPFPNVPWSMGVPLTGLIMGLGSSPTHEVIQAIQQFKQDSNS